MEKIIRDETFERLAQRCARGDAQAMAELGDWFERRVAQEDAKNPSLEERASCFWHYRAMKKGSETGRLWVERWYAQHPGREMPAPFAWQPRGDIEGALLAQVGFLFFRPDESYAISSPDEDGVVEAKVYCGDSGWDEDGFGSEIEYDWYFLDENLSPIPGADPLKGWSNRDVRVLGAEYRQKVGRIQRERK